MRERPESELLTEVEILLKKRFAHDPPKNSYRTPSSAKASKTSPRVRALVLPDDERPKMPLTKDKYLVKDNPHVVQWEREVRKFLRNLTPEHENRIAAVMIYEWATGIRVAELMAEGGSARSDLGVINKVLRFYFGRSYMTYICGRKIPLAFRVPKGYYIRRHRPMTLTLWAEYHEGTLYP